jgi:PAS domain S-box-containing protein
LPASPRENRVFWARGPASGQRAEAETTPSSRRVAHGTGRLQILWEDGERVFCRVWRGADDDDQAAVLAVVPAAEPVTASCVDRLTHEYALRDALDSAWAVRPLELVREPGQLMLVLEDPGGEPLDGLLGTPMEVGRFLHLAISIAAALGKLHQRGIVHKDVKPANILVTRPSGEVKLTGFGIASRLPRERQAPEPPEFIAGTLAYMAPEQTGRMNRSIDSRSDLYALGVTLYQMLTGRLPFAASEPLEWVHCHIARRPVPPSERLSDVPAAISQIIMKLLAKTAEERYQTAGGVERDLKRCLAEWEARGHINDLPLGQYDTPDRLLIPEKLYGRAREVDTLLAAFDRVAKGGATELVLVSGYSGIGKSSVVNELHKALVAQRGLFASGKFDQYKRHIPYSTLVQAVQGLLRPLLGKSDAELARWRDVLLEAVGANGRLLVDLVPELKLIIGEQPPVPELSPQDAQRLFQLVFRRFIGVFARPEHPLALFLDDLQWLDAATLDLLEILLTQGDVQHLLLIGAYRDNEVDDAHPLRRVLVAAGNAGGRIEEITLSPLASEHVGRLIADTLRCETAHAGPLARLAHDKSAGNPFFVIQFLYALAEEGLLGFDAGAGRWSWDLDRIHAKGYTDNVVDLMVGKLTRLPAETQTALQLLACLGNNADVSMLSIVLAASEEQVHAALRDAVRLELVQRQARSYRFIHDRVHEAAYALTPAAERSAVHLRIGRLQLERMSVEEVRDHVFDLVGHLNAGVAIIVDSDERDDLAQLNLLAGRKAKAATAYASASRYLSVGRDLLGASGWDRRYQLAFGLCIEAAECEYLNGNLETAERLLSELLAHASSKLDRAAAYRLQILFHVTSSAYQAATDCGLECLRLFGITIPPHPTREQIETEHEKFWASLAGRSIESLIDQPLASDPEDRAIAAMLTFMFAPTSFTNSSLFHMLICRGANLTLDHGVSEAAIHIYSGMAQILGPILHRYEDGLRFANLSHQLADKYGFSAAKAHFATQNAAPWCRPIQTAVDHAHRGYRVAVDSGDLTYGCYFSFRLVNCLLMQGSPLDMVGPISQEGVELARRIKFRDAVDMMTSQQAFIANMRGETRSFSSFDSALFDEAAFEAGFTADRMPVVICWYWILKLQARLISGDPVAARAAARNARALISSSKHFAQWASYVYFAALSIAALDENSPDIAAEEPDELREHLAQLREWADACPSTFLGKYTLVAAELARLEDREFEAMQLYEAAIRLAQEHDLPQDEAIAHERAARFCTARGLTTIAANYLRLARDGYLRWGAVAKVTQLDRLNPRVLAGQPAPRADRMLSAPVEQLDLATVIRVSQAVSGEIVLEKLIDTIMRTAIEHAGAERGLLIVPRGAEPRIEAEATTAGEAVEVRLRDEAITENALPGTVLHYVLRTQESVILDDASAQNPFSADPYLCQHKSHSILCAPLINQGRLIGVLYLENNLAPRVFAPARSTVLKLLASQAASALENIRLYHDVAEREAKIRRLVESNIVGIFIWDLAGGILEANDAFLRMIGHDREDLVAGRLRWTKITPREWGERDAQLLRELKSTGILQPFEKEYFRKDGSRVPVLIGVATFEEGGNQGVAFVLDLTARKRAEGEARESERRYREVLAGLAHANRVAAMGQLTASIAHEVSQPITGAGVSGQVARHWLAHEPPDLPAAQRAVERIIRDVGRAGAVMGRIRALIRKAPTPRERLDVNDTIGEVLALTRAEAVKNDVLVRTELAVGLPLVEADRIELQQVILNLIINAIEAMAGTDATRELLIATRQGEPSGVVVAVTDSGPGLDPARLEQVFEPFFTTKPTGLGMGLPICRSIVEAHGGRLVASMNVPRGAIFSLALPAPERLPAGTSGEPH